jgi:outer membrane protein OmpA-like peptidoglycan-associated protein
MLRPKPRNSLVVVGKGEITIKQQIQFALDSAVILPESFGLLTEIADTLIRHTEIRRVEVQGHTDNSGTPEHNKVLSEQRAEAVRAWLVQHGVGSDKLVAQGLRSGEAGRAERHGRQSRAESPRAVHHRRQGRGRHGASPASPRRAREAPAPGLLNLGFVVVLREGA